MERPQDSVEISGRSAETASQSTRADRSFLGLHFRCSGQYSRATKTPDGSAYVGRCPRCAACVRFPIGEGGTSRRFFEVSCRG